MSIRCFGYVLVLTLLFSATDVENTAWVNGRYWYFVDNIETVDGASPEILLWLALPMDHLGQKIKIEEIYPKPVEIIHDVSNGNEIAFWRITDLSGKTQLHFYYDFMIRTEEVVSNILPEDITPYDIESEMYKRYTRSEPWIEITPEINIKAQEIVGNETNAYHKARKIFDWVIANMIYEYPDIENRGAAKSIKTLKGDCGEFSFVFAAMCRASGIPARTITCLWFGAGGHAWAEIYLPPYGWVPVDPSVGQALAPGGSKAFPGAEAIQGFMESRGIPRKDPYYVFGNLYPKRMIVLIGNNVEAISSATGIQRTFRFMQPGGLAASPPSIELNGLWDKTVHAGFCVFGEKSDDLEYATDLSEKELAASYLRVDLFDKAERGLLKKVVEKPEDAVAWLNLGQVYLNTDKTDKAIEALRNCLEGKAGSIKPAIDQWAHNILGNCFDMKGMRDSALIEYQKVIDANINFQGAVDSAKQYMEHPFYLSKG